MKKVNPSTRKRKSLSLLYQTVYIYVPVKVTVTSDLVLFSTSFCLINLISTSNFRIWGMSADIEEGSCSSIRKTYHSRNGFLVSPRFH